MAIKIEEIQNWCRNLRVVARGVRRGADFTIGEDGSTPDVPVADVFHWEVRIEGNRYPCSTSDMERVVTGKMTLDQFVDVMKPRRGRNAE